MPDSTLSTHTRARDTLIKENPALRGTSGTGPNKGLPILSTIEQEVLGFCRRAAEDGRHLEPTEEIMAAIGATGSATVPGIMKRLEQKGYIRRNIYQRGRQVCITATGQCSLPPRDTSPHWRLRDRSNDAPAPAIQQTRQRAMSMFAMIEQAARLERKPITEFLVDLVYIGWHAYADERDEAA